MAFLSKLFGSSSIEEGDAAIARLRRTARADRKDDRVRVRLGNLLRQRGDNRGALLTYWEAVEINLASENDRRALAILKQIVACNAGDAEAHLALARVYERMGLLSEAAGQQTVAAAALKREGRFDLAIEMQRKSRDLGRVAPLV